MNECMQNLCENKHHHKSTSKYHTTNSRTSTGLSSSGQGMLWGQHTPRPKWPAPLPLQCCLDGEASSSFGVAERRGSFSKIIRRSSHNEEKCTIAPNPRNSKQACQGNSLALPCEKAIQPNVFLA